LSVCLFLFTNIYADKSRSIRFTHLTNDESLPNNTAYSVCQDYKGFIWIATKNGLCKYDGKNISTYYVASKSDESEILSNQMRCVFEDGKKRLWAVSLSDVNLYNRDMDRFESVLHFYTDNVFIRTICSDKDNNVYAAGNELLVYNEKLHKFEPLLKSDKLVEIARHNNNKISRNISSLVADNNGRLWGGNMFEGLICVDTRTGELTYYNADKNNPASLVSNKIVSLYKDSKEQIWIGTEDKGICCYDSNSKRFIRFAAFPDVCVRAFAEDPEGNIWIGTEDGLYIYSPETGTFTRHKQNINDKYALNDNAIYTIFRDREDNMLLGTYFGGVNILPHSFRHFHYYNYGNSDRFLSGKAVRQIVGDESGNLWIATEDGGLDYYNKQKDRFEYFKPDKSKNSISYFNVHSLLLDSRQNLWAGTYLGGLNKYNLKTKRFTHYFQKNYPNMIVDNVFTLIEDRDGQIWVGTTNGLTVYNPDRDRFARFKPQKFGAKSVNHLLLDADGSIWIATRKNGLFRYDKDTDSLRNFSHTPDPNSLSDNYVNFVFEDSKKNIWAGTYEGGLCRYNRQTETFTVYREENGLPSNTVFGIIESNSGNLWISTNNGLSCMDVTGGAFTNYSVSEGLPNKQFNYNSVYKDAQGILYFGTINGMIAFNPEDMETMDITPHVEFTDFKIFGKSVIPDEENSPLSKNIEEIGVIHLNSKQAQSFTLEFTVPTLSHPNSTSFAIKLNTDNNWSYIGQQRHVTYANLPSGEYRIMVKAAFNNNWTGDKPVKSITVIIDPPFYLSTVAYAIYMLAVAGVVLFFYNQFRRRQKEKNLILLERLEKEKIKEVNNLKLNFFTNISHELKTPLSLILIPLQSFLDKNIFNQEIRPKMELIANNALRMNHLIDELMLFTKVETKQEKIRVKKGDLLNFISNIGDGFRVLADEKGIEYLVQVSPSSEEVCFAPEKVEKIIYNLLSNAFKYTVAGRIMLTAFLEHEEDFVYLHLSVSDTGIGIAPDELEKIFENYYQVNDYVKSRKTGFGIGLALTRELVSLHKGTISVDSKPGKGSIFRVKLNVSPSAFAKNEISGNDADARFIEEYKYISVKIEDKETENQANTIDKTLSNKQYKILIVEDNQELLNFYRELFSDIYTVIAAEDGKKGLEMARTQLPDIIVSDVMMPEMTGTELARKLKTSLDTCHIPLLLLTAKTGDEAQLEGYNSGADLYIEKPFHPALMRKQISNLLNTKENQKKLYIANKVELSDIVANERDKKLITDIEKIILKNLDNEAFSINDIMKEIGIGRTLLHVKLKSVVGLSTTEFINNIRIKESVKALLSGSNVSEAAYATGFSSPGYYTHCFKKIFGLSPTEYLANKKGGGK
jgi:ligand-binding sensor domain-containing protein/signal transduction histidine kinase/DNA-binding response OmpR family regulator